MRRPFLLFFLLAAASVHAQSTQADIEARLLHKPLYLRGLWRDDKLHFDASGHLRSTSPTASFTLAGIEVTAVQLGPKKLLLEGKRIGLRFDGLIPRRVPLVSGSNDDHGEKIGVEVDVSPTGDYTTALDSMFITDLADLVPTLPEYWQRYAKAHLLHSVATETPALKQTSPAERKVGGDVTPPRVLNAPEPEFDRYMRRQKIEGNSLVYLHIQKDGTPSDVSVIRPLGLGFDEKAVEAVKQYRFKPAMEHGEPVVVEMNVEVNFRIF